MAASLGLHAFQAAEPHDEAERKSSCSAVRFPTRPHGSTRPFALKKKKKKKVVEWKDAARRRKSHHIITVERPRA